MSLIASLKTLAKKTHNLLGKTLAIATLKVVNICFCCNLSSMIVKAVTDCSISEKNPKQTTTTITTKRFPNIQTVFMENHLEINGSVIVIGIKENILNFLFYCQNVVVFKGNTSFSFFEVLA